MSNEVLDQPTAYEIERGKPMPSLNHGAIQANLIMQFGKAGTHRIVSEYELEMPERPNLVPDLSIFQNQPIDLLNDQIRSTEPPLMTVEILSPRQGDYDVVKNAQRYLAHGVKSCWIIHPSAHTIQILTPDGEDAVITEGIATDPATGLKADLDVVFS